MPADAENSVISTVLLGHQVSSPNVEARLDGVSFWGHATRVVDVRIPSVTLLADTSTPQKPSLDPDAEAEFKKAAAALLANGIEFYTCLRPTWALPWLLWTRDER